MYLENYSCDWTGRIVTYCHYYKTENKKYALVLEDKGEALQFYNSRPPPDGYEYHSIKILWIKQKGDKNLPINGKIETKIKKYLVLVE